MRKYVLKRILISIVILFFVSFIIYGLMRCLPTSYIERMAQQKAMAPGSKSYEDHFRLFCVDGRDVHWQLR